jgi:hypothetical protein
MITLTEALAKFEQEVQAALQERGAPINTILNAKRSLLAAIETMPDLRAIALIEEGTRYVRHLAGYWDKPDRPKAA